MADTRIRGREVISRGFWGMRAAVPGYEGIRVFRGVKGFRSARVSIPGYEGNPGYDGIPGYERIMRVFVPGSEGISAEHQTGYQGVLVKSRSSTI